MKNLLFLVGLTIAFIACRDDDSLTDYRAAYIGTYEATKSNRGFDDENFRTDIDDIVIELSTAGDSLILFDGIELPLQDNGTTGFQNIDGFAYELSFEADTFRLITYPVLGGFPAFCYIIGERS